MFWHSEYWLYVCTCVCLCVFVSASTRVCVLLGQWGEARVCPGGLEGMQVAQSTICHASILGWYLTTCSVEFKRTHTHIYTHAATHTHTWSHTDVHKHTEAWRGEMKYPHQSYTETWRPKPGDRDHTSDHMTLGYRCTATHTHKCTHPHTPSHFFMASSLYPRPWCVLCI